MMSFEEVAAIVAGIECRPYKIALHDGRGGVWYLQASLDRPCVDTGAWGVGRGGKYHVSPHATEGEIVQKALAACLAYAEHEVREHFAYKSKRIFNPHIDPLALMKVCDLVQRRDEPGMRTPPEDPNLEG